MENYQNLILKFLCERQNHKIKSNSKNVAFGITDEMIESILREINERPCKETPISEEVLTGIFNSFLKDFLIEIYKSEKNKYIMSRKAYETAKVNMLEARKLIKKKKVMEINENIECRQCLMVDGYTPRQTKCRYCGAILRVGQNKT
ncbi:hypothetical protein HQ584_08040 [Patescibacteria group bacterium]|nr:hypothetical protein [Patescibacteria group bacterium]